MKAIARGAMLLSAMALTASAYAQISLSTAVDLATKSDPRVREAQADLAKAKAGLAQTKDAFVPTVSASGGYGTSTGVPLGLPIAFQLSSQSLLFSFSQRDNLRAAEFEVHSAELALKDARAKVAGDAALTYIDLNNAQQRLAAIRTEYGDATRLQQIVSDRFTAGQDTQLDLHNASLTADKIELNILETRVDVATKQDHLARMIGLPGTPLQTVSNSIPPLPNPKTFSGNNFMSYGVRSAYADARSRQEMAFGEARYRWRPQIGFGANYARISTAQSNYSLYYPGFKESSNGTPNSDNALSFGISIEIPLFNKLHDDKAKGSAADAAHAMAAADDARNQFLEGRVKLQQNATLLSARVKVAEDEKDIAGDQLNATLAQLTASSGDSGGHQLSPEDEQNARIQVSARTVDMLNAQLSLDDAEINLLLQTNTLNDWLKQAVTAPEDLTVRPARP
jgi:outer membrane protein TolC